MSAYLSLLQKAVEKSLDTVPEGWKTTEELSKEWGRAPSTVRPRIGPMVKAGLLEGPRMFRVMAGTRVLPVPHYKVK